MSTKMTGRVEENIQRLQRYQAFEIQMSRLLGGWLPGIVRWEDKHTVGCHLWEDAEHSREMRTRLWELRIPNPDRGSVEQVLPVIKALAQAQHDYELLAGVYLVLKTQLLAAYKTYLETTYSVYDAPSLGMFRRIITEEEDQIVWARKTITELTDTDEKHQQVERWIAYAQDVLLAAGGVGGTEETSLEAALLEPPPAYRSLLPFPQALRDERFEVRLEGMPRPASDDHLEHVRWQFINYMQEMQAAETLGSVLWEVEGMPWEFYYDLARHCADEVRHSKLGETRLAQLGFEPSDFPQFVGNYAWRQLVDPLHRYCILTYVIETGAFELKHSTYQEHIQQGDTESAQAVLFDILDETMHVRFGHRWVPELIKHYKYDQPIEELVAECQRITLNNTLAPAQREAALRKAE